MLLFRNCVAGFLSLALSGAALAQVGKGDVQAIDCGKCAAWNAEQAPFNIFGNTWYVGTRELSSVLITGDQGHVLIDGALPQSAAQIERHIKQLGFDIRDVKLIVNSHPHFDHAGGIAALRRASGAKVAASAPAAAVLKAGVIGADDPQFEPSNTHFPALDQVIGVSDGQTLMVGALALTAHLTPGHTQGGASWTWRACEKERCLQVAYLDSLYPASTDGFRFSGGAGRPAIATAFMASIDKVAALPCDVALSAHPDFTDMLDKLAARTAARNPFVDGAGCRAYAADARQRLTARLAKERGARLPAPQ
ncbi:MAG: subclass B3 metallo-beta-lactamase [Pseudomonadota bacterium]